MRSALVLLVFSLLAPSQATAQLPGDLNSPTVRAGALGGASVLQRPTPGTVHVNPALSGDASGADIGWRWTGDEATAAWAAFEGGGFVFGLRHQSSDRHLGVGVDESPAPTDLGLSVAGSRGLFGFDIGVGVALVERTVWTDRDRAVYLNVGVSRDVSEFRLAASILGLGTGTSAQAPSDPLGDAISTGLPSSPVILLQASSSSLEVGPLDVIFAGRMHVTDGQSSAGGGLEVGYWPVTGRTFRLLGGYGQNPLSLETRPTWGASFSGDAITLEFASFRESGRNTHTVGLRWR